MKKLSLYVFLVLMFCVNAIAVSKDRDAKLNQFFELLQKDNDALYGGQLLCCEN